eukprot:CAMPEP_0119058524 /NCGR_PEP_ID=MMETSP1178-20130426/2819_1 /TAXON_ID=33656 /ORGANISM="unid sp, Strain CCMP2000" /LENGTH=118 /DNA_ID=CAMNT_0007039467 /DNA_START=269 /DNA_END=622 /DNA_ORIENTATION=+
MRVPPGRRRRARSRRRTATDAHTDATNRRQRVGWGRRRDLDFVLGVPKRRGESAGRRQLPGFAGLHQAAAFAGFIRYHKAARIAGLCLGQSVEKIDDRVVRLLLLFAAGCMALLVQRV